MRRVLLLAASIGALALPMPGRAQSPAVPPSQPALSRSAIQAAVQQCYNTASEQIQEQSAAIAAQKQNDDLACQQDQTCLATSRQKYSSANTQLQKRRNDVEAENTIENDRLNLLFDASGGCAMPPGSCRALAALLPNGAPVDCAVFANALNPPAPPSPPPAAAPPPAASPAPAAPAPSVAPPVPPMRTNH
jgi:hypothetical protein